MIGNAIRLGGFLLFLVVCIALTIPEEFDYPDDDWVHDIRESEPASGRVTSEEFRDYQNRWRKNGGFNPIDNRAFR